jgi:EAL domain-containing protein (putative c-di-GMP-specific phosphodiesterase class I)
MRVIVEGVKEPAQLILIRDMGADEVQGFLLGCPGPEPSTRWPFDESDMDEQVAFESRFCLLAEQS